VPLRITLFERSGPASAALLLGALAVALAGGVLLSGRSGWCSTLCPLLPVQRLYGQTPFAVVRNSTASRVSAARSTASTSTRVVAQVADLHDEERAPARKLFAGAFPGLVIVFFTAPAGVSTPELYGRVGVAALAGGGAIYALDTLVHPPPALLTAVFGGLALNLFYWYLLPKLGVPSWLAWAERGALLGVTAVWLRQTFRSESAVVAEDRARAGSARLDPAAAAALAGGGAGYAEVRLGERRIAVASGTTLLEVVERLELPIEPGCRMGVCGSDPVWVVAGADNLSAIEASERATLEWLGLVDGTRMACCARVSGPVELSLDTRRADTAGPSLDGDVSIERVVIVGNGIAGVTAANYVRRGHGKCEVHLIGRERHNLYNRMAITRLIYGRSGMHGLYLLPDSWYEENGITTWLNTHVERINREARTVVLATGEVLSYDRLILTAGSSGFVPEIDGWGARGTFVLRTADDAMAIREHLQANHARTAALAGGGLLGLEAAYALSKYGARPTIVQRGDYLLPRQLDRRGAGHLRTYLEGLGMEFALDAEVAAVHGDPVGEIGLSNGRVVACELLLATAGIVPNDELPRAAGLEVNRGIVVDEGMRTSDPFVYAAGDVAEHRDRVWGLWPTAVEQGRIAAVNALGGGDRFQPVPPLTMLKVSGVDLTSIGRIEAEEGDETIVIEELGESRYRKLVLRDGSIVGGILLGYTLESAGLTRAVQERLDMSAHLDRLRAGDWEVFVDHARAA
jgi:NADPH-dependent 2,4-dienoyl-CoA reductase/sulfur reductase-like enzyme/ferredoxin